MNTRRSGTSVGNVGQRRPQAAQPPQALANSFVQGGQMKPQQQPLVKMPQNQQQQQQQQAAGPPKLQQQQPTGPPKLQQQPAIPLKPVDIKPIAPTPARPVAATVQAQPVNKQATNNPVKQQQQVKPAVPQQQQPIRPQLQGAPQMQTINPQQQQLKQQTPANKAAPAAVPVTPAPKAATATLAPKAAAPQAVPALNVGAAAPATATVIAANPVIAAAQPILDMDDDDDDEDDDVLGIKEESTFMDEDGKTDEGMLVDVDGGNRKKMKWSSTKGNFRFTKADKLKKKNARFRKILQPKNALMILNEINGSTQYKFVELSTQENALKGIKHPSGFKAVTIVNGVEYSGTGLDKVTAKSNAAEAAIKSIILRKILSASSLSKQKSAASNSAANSSGITTDDGASDGPNAGKDNNGDVEMMEGEVTAAAGKALHITAEGEMVPWMHIASFALHKLFNSWEETGTLLRASSQGNLAEIPEPIIPSPKISTFSTVSPPIVNTQTQAPQRALPENALMMHPVMLLNQMRPGTTYFNELELIGSPPQTLYSYECIVEGKGNFMGKGPNKKIARRNAAYAACQEVLNLVYTPEILGDIAQSSEPRKYKTAVSRTQNQGAKEMVMGGVGEYFMRQSNAQQIQQLQPEQGSTNPDLNARDGYTTGIDPGYQWY